MGIILWLRLKNQINERSCIVQGLYVVTHCAGWLVRVLINMKKCYLSESKDKTACRNGRCDQVERFDNAWFAFS